MAYDDELAHRVRELLADEDGLSEMRMFGGLAFLIDGNMSVAVSSQGGLMVRVDPDTTEDALARPHTREFAMRGRPLAGWVRVDVEGVATKRLLAAWVRRGVAFARTLPPKS
jgi:TfoX/Sxy family transcriptional regulator of competence genes